MSSVLPRARRDGLAVQEIATETLIYDLERHRAHSLNPTATLVWRSCNGRTSYRTVARRLEKELGVPADEELVRLIVHRLAGAALLQGEGSGAGYSRREFVKKLNRLGIVASTVLPLVASIVSPTEAYAQSCVPATTCSGKADCTPCLNPGGNCNPTWRCCNGQCMSPGQALNNCGCA